MPSRIKPPALRLGDTVGIVAPASNIHREALETGSQALRSLGFSPFYFDSIFEKDIYFAGSAERRARELEEMFVRDEVRAIICARGGYGSNYLLPLVDIETIKKHPKIFMGYSDLTCLLTYFADAAEMVTFHGPMVAKDFGRIDGVEFSSWKNALSGTSQWTLEVNPEVKALVEGSAEGILYGGCLSILVASLGTPYEIQTEGTVLFLEDVAAKAFQIDRMLMHLKLAGKFDERPRNNIWRDAGLRPESGKGPGVHSGRGCSACGWRLRNSSRLRIALRSRYSGQHNSSNRRSSGFEYWWYESGTQDS